MCAEVRAHDAVVSLEIKDPDEFARYAKSEAHEGRPDLMDFYHGEEKGGGIKAFIDRVPPGRKGSGITL